MRPATRVIRLLVIAAGLYVALCLIVFLARHRLVFPLRGGAAGEPASFGIRDGLSVVIPVSGGDTLAAWWLPAVPSAERNGVMIWFHGNGETVAGLAPVFRDFRPAGVAMLAVEYRGYGASTGTPTVSNSEEDALAIWDWLAKRADVDTSRIVAYGRSIGTGPAIHLASSRPLAGLIVESGFTSLRGLARLHYPIIPSFIGGSGFDNLMRMTRVSCPVLFVHGDQDRIIPNAMGQALAAAARNQAGFVVIMRADHNDTYDMGGEGYVSRVRDFVAQTTR